MTGARAELLLAVAGLTKAAPTSSPFTPPLACMQPDAASTAIISNPSSRGHRKRASTTSSGHALFDLLQHACTPSFRKKSQPLPVEEEDHTSSGHRKHTSLDMDRSRGTTYSVATWSSSYLRNARKSMVDSCGTSKAFNARNQHRLLSLTVSQHHLTGRPFPVNHVRRITPPTPPAAKSGRGERENNRYLHIVTLERSMYHQGKLTKIPTLGRFALRKRLDEPRTPSKLRYGWTAEQVELLDAIE